MKQKGRSRRSRRNGLHVLARQLQSEFDHLGMVAHALNLAKIGEICAAMLLCRTVNTSELAEVLPRDGKNNETRLKAILRLLSEEKIVPHEILKPLARKIMKLATALGKTAVIAMDQSMINKKFQCVCIGICVRSRAVPLAFIVRETEGSIGFDDYVGLLDDFAGMIPEGVKIMLAADRFYGNAKLIDYCKKKGWKYRIRLKGNISLQHLDSDLIVSDLATEEFLKDYPDGIEGAELYGTGVTTSIGVLHEKGHEEPWFIAMDVKPTKGRVRDYGLRWGIECMFSDAKSRGFNVCDTQLKKSDRIERLLMLISICFYFAVFTGMVQEEEAPTYSPKKAARSALSLFKRGLRWIRSAIVDAVEIPSLWQLADKFHW